jgi:hypothetical protein
MTRRGFFEDVKSEYEIVEAEQEVCLDLEMRGSILEAQRAFDENVDTKFP